MHTPMQTNPLYTTAINFLIAHQDDLAHVPHMLLTRCISHVIDQGDVSRDTAHVIAVQAAGELSARGRREYIDCSRTTSYALFLSDGTGKTKAVMIDALIRIIDQAQLGAPT